MARAGIYKSEVVRARDNLLAMGRYPSIDAIRGELGNTGSKGTIHRYLKEIEEEEVAALAPRSLSAKLFRIYRPAWPSACIRKPISAWRH